MNKNKKLKAALLIFILGASLIALASMTVEPRENLSPVERGLRITAAPLQGGITGVGDRLEAVAAFFAKKAALQSENENLKATLGALQQENTQLKEVAMENIRLQEMLGYKNKSQGAYDLLFAKIISENTSNLQHTVTIDRGSNDGIAAKMIVVNHQGLVGRITSVMPNSSEVMLLLDRQSALGVRIWETRETPGVVEGMGSEQGKVKMIHMAHDVDIAVGDTIVTSGFDQLFPPGLYVGKVVRIFDDASGLMKEAEIDPFVDFRSLEDVFVMTNFHAVEPIVNQAETEGES